MEKVDALASYVKEMRSGSVDEAEQAMFDQLTHILTNYKARRALRDASIRLHHQPDFDLRVALNRSLSEAASCPNVVREPTWGFNKLPVSAPDYEWLHDADEQMKRKIPIPKPAPPREEETVQGELSDSPRAGKKAE
ncbi:hypothetical protein T484DRAFT_1892255 [Baffinella frigidus]|nr:hypothetical protein T484DRAFT_1892255 [Cryptophyta sp. CCMP2293]